MSVSRALRAARQRSGLSLRGLADLAGTSHATLRAYESGAKVPRVDTLARILRAAGFCLDLELSARAEGGDAARAAKGRELEQALELAAEFPADQPRTLQAPRFGRTS